MFYNIYALGFLVHTLFCVKWLARLSIYIHADILVLVSEFVVVVILSEWWSVLTTADHCGHIPDQNKGFLNYITIKGVPIHFSWVYGVMLIAGHVFNT